MTPAGLTLVLGTLLLAACFPTAGSSAPKEKPPKPTPSVAATASPEPSAMPSDVPSLTLSAIQRLNQRVGYIAGWTGTGLELAKTSDDGTTWERLPIPVSRLTALRFIDERVGWAGGFADRDVPQFACQQAAHAGAQPCKRVVLHPADGGRTAQSVLA